VDVSIDRQIINVNECRLVANADEFVQAISALAQRTEAEGEPGVLRYQFYVDRDGNTAMATIVYEDAEAWLNHHRIAYTWPEMAVLQATVELQRLTYLGPLNEEIEAMASAVKVPVVHHDTLAAGFCRSS
jgi:quinol monooxygenase YgiN